MLFSYRKLIPRALLVSFFLVGLVTGCSRLDIGLKFADTFLIRQIDQAFDLDKEQKQTLEAPIQASVQKVRSEYLPLLGGRLRHFESQWMAPDSLTDEEIAGQIEGVILQVRDFTKIELGAWTPLSSKLTPAQMDHFKEYIHKRRAEREKNYSKGLSYQKTQVKRWRRTFEYFFGFWSKDIETSLIEHLNANPFPRDLQREHQEQNLKAFLQTKEAPERRSQILTDLLEKSFGNIQGPYGEALKAYQKASLGWWGKTLASLTAEQKQKAAQTLLKRAAQFEKGVAE